MPIRKSSTSGIPKGNTASRPTSPTVGDVFYNGETGVLEIYNGTVWVPCSAPPGVPSLVAQDVGTSRAYGSGGISLTFTPSSLGGSPLGYIGSASIGATSYTTGATTNTTTTLTVGNNGTYTVSSTAYNGFGSSSASIPVNLDVTTVPQAPTIGTATASTSANEITVTWTLNNNGGKNLNAITITPYLNGTTAQTSRTAATTSSTSYTFTKDQLVAGSSYTFKVKATNANGDSLESSASNSATMPDGVQVHFLVIAGGGGGGGNNGGGGGAGGYRTSFGTSGANSPAESQLFLSRGTNYTVTVGGGDAANNAGNGGNSVFATITSNGGGGANSDDGHSASGGSGGGGNDGGNAGSGITNQGNSGGSAADGYGGGGGGGAGAVGGTVTPGGGSRDGGNGIASSITGSSVTRGGGGGGIYRTNFNNGNGGAGGGGSAGNPGTSNTGGGGGQNGNGGSGVVIVRWPTAQASIIVGAGLTADATGTDGSDSYKVFTAGSGNVSFS